MREFRITVAQCDSSGIVRPDIAERFGARLAATYGGFTRTDATGGYIMADGRFVSEPVFIFDVGTAADAESVLTFAKFAAHEIRRAMDQESAYLRNVDGTVHILSAPPKPVEADKTCGGFGWPEASRYASVTINGATDKRNEKDADKPPATIGDRVREIRKIAESMATADTRRGGAPYGGAVAILATACDSYIAESGNAAG